MNAAKVTQRKRGEAVKMQIRARITHVGSEYRKDVTSGTCELCIADWSARIRDISFELTDVKTGVTWQVTTPTLHVGRWNDVWEVRVNPFHLSKALAHVTLVVDTDRLHDEGGRVPHRPRHPRGRRSMYPCLRHGRAPRRHLHPRRLGRGRAMMRFGYLERGEEGGRGAPGWTERATQKFAGN